MHEQSKRCREIEYRLVRKKVGKSEGERLSRTSNKLIELERWGTIIF
jgi:hypothetical protein